jgi:peroxiredoxin (alkyl hydroperoxide reductase subunit C)
MEELPDDLPAPIDDGAADHLAGSLIPSVELASTAGGVVDLSAVSKRTVAYAYPMSGPDNTGLPDDWDAIPGARGCTPQHCSLRNHHTDLNALGVDVYGLATQPVDYLRGEVRRS